jgi:N-acetyl-anhydromuramyl-L-alanine amidase AmpD
MAKPAFTERVQWCNNYHARSLAGIKYGAIHTQEGNGTAASLANYFMNSEVSYHSVVDNARNVVHCVDDDDASWSVGNANNYVVNVCFAGSFSGWSRQEWLDKMGNGIEIAAWLQVDAANRKKFPAFVRGWDDLKNFRNGLTDHRGINMGVLGVKGHTDVGDNFPWDVYTAHVNRFRTEGTAPTVTVVQPPARTAIEACRDANEWLGKKLTKSREETTPDGQGKYVHYDGGSVYWHPRINGGKFAYAVPKAVVAKWETLGWELGELGYPVDNHLDLVPFKRSDGRPVRGGIVQKFEGGNIYVSDLGAFVVKGLIKERFASLGYETKDVGWPMSDERGFGNSKYGGTYQNYEGACIYWFNQGNSTVAYRLQENKLTGEILLPAN